MRWMCSAIEGQRSFLKTAFIWAPFSWFCYDLRGSILNCLKTFCPSLMAIRFRGCCKCQASTKKAATTAFATVSVKYWRILLRVLAQPNWAIPIERTSSLIDGSLSKSTAKAFGILQKWKCETSSTDKYSPLELFSLLVGGPQKSSSVSGHSVWICSSSSIASTWYNDNNNETLIKRKPLVYTRARRAVQKRKRKKKG